MVKINKKRKIVFVLILFLYLGYLIAANSYLQSDTLREKFNRRPDKVLVEYREVLTYFPFRFTVHSLTVSGSPKSSYSVCADHTTFWLNPLPLVVKKVHIVNLKARGVDFVLLSSKWKKKWASMVMKKRASGTPAFEKGDETPKPKKKTWGISVQRAKMKHIRYVSIDEYLFVGDAACSVSFSRNDEIREFQRGLISFKKGFVRKYEIDEPLFNRFSVDLRFSVSPYNNKKVKGKKTLSHFSGELQLKDVYCSDLNFLQSYLKRSQTLSITGGAGAFQSSCSHTSKAVEGAD